MDERNNEGTDQAIINIIKNDLREEITIHDIDVNTPFRKTLTQ